MSTVLTFFSISFGLYINVFMTSYQAL